MKLTEEDYRRAIFSASLKIYDDEIPTSKDLSIILHAANKQIGKPVVRLSQLDERCPCCNNEVNYRYIYCCKCGQKLDWRYKNR